MIFDLIHIQAATCTLQQTSCVCVCVQYKDWHAQWSKRSVSVSDRWISYQLRRRCSGVFARSTLESGKNSLRTRQVKARYSRRFTNSLWWESLFDDSKTGPLTGTQIAEVDTYSTLTWIKLQECIYCCSPMTTPLLQLCASLLEPFWCVCVCVCPSLFESVYPCTARTLKCECSSSLTGRSWYTSNSSSRPSASNSSSRPS